LENRSCEEELQARIGYRFCSLALLRESLTHKSFSNESLDATPPPHNERLEFLGDAVLDLAVSCRIFRDYPDLPEGELTRIRSEVVSERGLSAVGRELGLGSCLLLGRGEERSGGREKPSLLADALEALLGAVFCDGGFAQVQSVVDVLFGAAVVAAVRHKTGSDHKTRLQEFFQARYGRLPAYRLAHAEGPDHQRLYTAEVSFDGAVIGVGQGRTKKGAEQAAALEALRELDA